MNNLSVRSLQGLLLLFLNKRDDFTNKNEEFYNLSINKILATINGMLHQLFAADLQTWDIYTEFFFFFFLQIKLCDMGNVFNKIWVMDRHTFKYQKHSSWQRQGRGKKWHTPFFLINNPFLTLAPKIV